MNTTEPGRAVTTPARRGRLTLDAVDAVDAIRGGDWTLADAGALLGADLAAGLYEYACALEVLAGKLSFGDEQLRADPLACLAAVRESVRRAATAAMRQAAP